MLRRKWMCLGALVSKVDSPIIMIYSILNAPSSTEAHYAQLQKHPETLKAWHPLSCEGLGDS
jgi:hypothetical protein